jgi:hypothetical protein
MDDVLPVARHVIETRFNEIANPLDAETSFLCPQLFGGESQEGRDMHGRFGCFEEKKALVESIQGSRVMIHCFDLNSTSRWRE